MHLAQNDLPCTTTLPCARGKRRHLKTYEDVVSAYISEHRPKANRLRQFFRRCATLKRAIEFAARCKLPSGKRHPHQYRIPAPVLAEAERRLRTSAAELRECQTFAELHKVVEDRLGAVRGIGPLTIYDIANHLGAHLCLEPAAVYLHAGAAAGAKAIGFDPLNGTLELTELPAAFHQLSPHEVEDCLCLYHDELNAIHSE
jgi:hypothetical protein